jgi:hypothetical protein
MHTPPALAHERDIHSQLTAASCVTLKEPSMPQCLRCRLCTLGERLAEGQRTMKTLTLARMISLPWTTCGHHVISKVRWCHLSERFRVIVLG